MQSVIRKTLIDPVIRLSNSTDIYLEADRYHIPSIRRFCGYVIFPQSYFPREYRDPIILLLTIPLGVFNLNHFIPSEIFDRHG